MKKTMQTLVLAAAVAVVSGWAGGTLSRRQMNDTQEREARGVESEYMIPASYVADEAEPLQRVDLTGAAARACEAVVYIRVTTGGETRTVEYSNPLEEFFFGPRSGGRQRRQVQTPKQEAAGSGVIISPDGYIVTNNHVVEGATAITVTLNDNREYEASIVGTDASTDLALLKISETGLPSLPIGDSDALQVGEWVLAVGNPFNLTSTVTAGIVSAKARNMGSNRNGIESFIQTDAAINQGNSGGALVNARGELVGINAMLYSQTGSFTGYGFAIPVSIMTKVVGDLQAYGTVQRALIGISGLDLHTYTDARKHDDSNYAADFGTLDGVYVAEVLDEGAAAQAGLREGDVIVSLGGKKVTKMSELQEATTKYSPGDKATVGYYRDKQRHAAEITFRNASGNTRIIEG